MNVLYKTLPAREAAFIILYNLGEYNISQIAKKLELSVKEVHNIPKEVIGYIYYNSHEQIFQIVVNCNKFLDPSKPQGATIGARRDTTIAYLVAYWIYYYDTLLIGEKYCINTLDNVESKLSIISSSIIMGYSNPLRL